MYKVKNLRAGKVKLNSGVNLRRGQEVVVNSPVLADADLMRLVNRGKVSITKLAEAPVFEKLGVVETEMVEPTAVEEVKEEPAVEEVKEEPAVEEVKEEPTIKRRSRRKSSTKKED
jgi:leucyl aminopeptidase (aminopeptidase T)